MVIDAKYIVFSGSRSHKESWVNKRIEKEILRLSPNCIVMHGGCMEGADTIADYYARKCNRDIVIVPPIRPTVSGYLRRNRLMSRLGYELIAVPRSLKSGTDALHGIVTRGGTEYTIRQFMALNKEVKIIVDEEHDVCISCGKLVEIDSLMPFGMCNTCYIGGE